MNVDMKAMAMKQAEDAKQAVQNLEMITRDPMKAQEQLLLRLLDDNKDTEYGKKYDFAGIHSIEEYQKKVPVSTYDDYTDYLKRMSEAGERNLITAYDMALYNKTSGTVGEPKRIPMTSNGVETFMKYNQSYEVGRLGQFLGASAGQGRIILLTLASANFAVMPDGLPFGTISDTITLKAKPFWTMRFTSPVPASFVVPGIDSRYLHARYALADPDPSKINCSSINFVYDFLHYIELNWEMLVKDIEAGTIDPTIKLPDDVREALTKELVPAPERANELRKIFEQGFAEPFVPKVWTNLRAVCGAATGTFKIYAEKVKQRYTGDIPMYCRGVAASEGVFSVPVELNSYDSVLIPDAVFFEFLPEGSDDMSSLVTLDRIEVGKKYELFITNMSGLYRYRMKDVLLVTGHHNNTPTVEFQYRSDKSVNISGEKTSEAAVRMAAEMTAAQCGFELVDSTMYPDLEHSRYRFIFETEERPEDLNREEIRNALESNLAVVNPIMGEIVRRGICAPTELFFAKAGTFDAYKEMLLEKGYSIGQVKPVTVITNEVQKQFFFSMIEN